MFIKICLKCYNEEHGPITKIYRKDGDGPMDEEYGVEACSECGGEMHCVKTRNQMGIADGDYSHISASLAINPCQTKAHRKLFPGIDVLPDGQLHFDSVRKQMEYYQMNGFEKMYQKIKQKGKQIAYLP